MTTSSNSPLNEILLPEGIDPEAKLRLTKDLLKAADSMGFKEARYIVRSFYQLQEYRISGHNQVRALEGMEQPILLLDWASEQFEQLEHAMKLALGHFVKHEPEGIGQWLLGITGIGPVLAAGLLAYIDIEKAPTTGHIWSYAGLNPAVTWEKKQKCPWNRDLKVLCYKIGESFVKFKGSDNDMYGKYYAQRKELEQARNIAGEFSEQASQTLSARHFREETEAHKWYTGEHPEANGVAMLPPAHIHARARRYAVKLFLSHFHDEWYRRHFHKEPPLPYPIAILNHQGMINAPEIKVA